MRGLTFLKFLLLSNIILFSACNNVKPDKKVVAEKTPDFIAEELIEQGKFDEAKSVLENFVSTMPPNWSYKTKERGKTRIVYWDSQSATRCFIIEGLLNNKGSTAVVGNSYSYAYFLLGFIATEQGDSLSANKFLDKSLELEPDNPLILIEKAGIMLDGANLERKYELYKKASSHYCIDDKMHAKALRGMGVTLIDMGKLDEAEKSLYESLKYDAGNQIAINELNYIDKLRAGAEKQKLQLINNIHHDGDKK